MFHGKIEKMCNRIVMAMEIDFEADEIGRASCRERV